MADVSGLSPDQQLIVAAYRGETDNVSRLIEEGADVNAWFGRGGKDFFDGPALKWTALLALAGGDHAESSRVGIARLLVESGADMNLDDGWGATALAYAVNAHHEALALFLIESGAEVNTTTGVYIDGPGDVTPLHDAADQPHVTQALLEAGATVNVRDTSGAMPLHWACLQGNLECVRLLLAAGADVDARDDEGRTPLYWVADRSGAKSEIERLLLDAGAKPL